MGGAALGFFGWIVVFWILVTATGSFDGGRGTSGAIYYTALVALLASAVGLALWPRTRRLGQGFVLALSVGFIIAGGICLPIAFGVV
jgi:hypothetical protein